MIHDVIGCTKPSWEGVEEVRLVELNNDGLYIATPPIFIENIQTKIEVFWKRANI